MKHVLILDGGGLEGGVEVMGHFPEYNVKMGLEGSKILNFLYGVYREKRHETCQKHGGSNL